MKIKGYTVTLETTEDGASYWWISGRGVDASYEAALQDADIRIDPATFELIEDYIFSQFGEAA